MVIKEILELSKIDYAPFSDKATRIKAEQERIVRAEAEYRRKLSALTVENVRLTRGVMLRVKYSPDITLGELTNAFEAVDLAEDLAIPPEPTHRWGFPTSFLPGYNWLINPKALIAIQTFKTITTYPQRGVMHPNVVTALKQNR